jgi:hypothetical protein
MAEARENPTWKAVTSHRPGPRADSLHFLARQNGQPSNQAGTTQYLDLKQAPNCCTRLRFPANALGVYG